LPFFESLFRSIHGFFNMFFRCHGDVSNYLLRICWVNGCQFFIGVDLFATDNKWVIFAQFTFHFFECRYIIVAVLLIMEISKCFVFIWQYQNENLLVKDYITTFYILLYLHIKTQYDG